MPVFGKVTAELLGDVVRTLSDYPMDFLAKLVEQHSGKLSFTISGVDNIIIIGDFKTICNVHAEVNRLFNNYRCNKLDNDSSSNCALSKTRIKIERFDDDSLYGISNNAAEPKLDTAGSASGHSEDIQQTEVCEESKDYIITRNTNSIDDFEYKHDVEIKDDVDNVSDASTEENYFVEKSPKSEDNTFNPFKCKLCVKAFNNVRSLNIHMRVHSAASTKRDNFHCAICDKSYQHHRSLYKHNRLHHSLSTRLKFQCDMCDIQYVNKKHMILHKLKAHAVHNIETDEYLSGSRKVNVTFNDTKRQFPPLQCNICEQYYPNTKALQTHRKLCNKEKTFLCDKCFCECSSRWSLAQHIRWVHEKNSVNNGQLALKNGENLDDEMDDTKPESNTEENVSASAATETPGASNAKGKPSVNGKSRGKKVKGGPRKYPPRVNITCRKCPFIASTEAIFYEHMKESHKYICEEKGCGKVCISSDRLKRHMEIHRAPLFTCHICARQYRAPRNFKAHIEKHNGTYVPKKVRCEYCGNSYSTPNYLRQHINAEHLGIVPEPNLCQQCGKTYKRKSQYYAHLRKHLPRPPPPTSRSHICDVCNKAFFTRKDLTRHKVIHREEWKYNCTVCQKRFKACSSFYIHNRTNRHQQLVQEAAAQCDGQMR